MDNFGGAAAWDAYCEQQYQELRRFMAETTCGQCDYYNEGICDFTGEEVNKDDYAIDIDCEDVQRRF